MPVLFCLFMIGGQAELGQPDGCPQGKMGKTLYVYSPEARPRASTDGKKRSSVLRDGYLVRQILEVILKLFSRERRLDAGIDVQT